MRPTGNPTRKHLYNVFLWKYYCQTRLPLHSNTMKSPTLALCFHLPKETSRCGENALRDSHTNKGWKGYLVGIQFISTPNLERSNFEKVQLRFVVMLSLQKSEAQRQLDQVSSFESFQKCTTRYFWSQGNTWKVYEQLQRCMITVFTSRIILM